MNSDPLRPLLVHFGAHARLFFSGNLCGDATFSDDKGVGYLHLLRRGPAKLQDDTGYAATLTEPTLVFYSRPLTHRFQADMQAGADLVCASMSFEHKAFNPIVMAFHKFMIFGPIPPASDRPVGRPCRRGFRCAGV